MARPRRKPKTDPAEAHARAYKRRTAQCHANHRRRAKDHGQWLDYTLEELRYLVSAALRRGHCTYCQGELTAANFGLDHKHPLARGGRHCHANLLVCCMACNAAKGPLDYYEFRELLAVVGNWRHEVKTNTLARLKAGARYAKLPPLSPDMVAGTADARFGKIEDPADLRRTQGRAVTLAADVHHVVHRRAETDRTDPSGPGGGAGERELLPRGGP